MDIDASLNGDMHLTNAEEETPAYSDYEDNYETDTDSDCDDDFFDCLPAETEEDRVRLLLISQSTFIA